MTSKLLISFEENLLLPCEVQHTYTRVMTNVGLCHVSLNVIIIVFDM